MSCLCFLSLFLYLYTTVETPLIDRILEPFIVSARKYRPKHFRDVVGQEAITSTLENAIESNHLAQALLFCGPRGVGKTTCARILARKINEDGTENQDEDFAFNIFELDAASNNSVDDIRSLTDQVRIPPQVGKYKVYIIDEVHMLSQAAFNAFLKTLEEPPKHAIFILATTEKHKIIPTILSRCQIFDFKRITVGEIAQYLGKIAEEQGVEAEDGALHIIAQKADGAMRDALSIFDRVVSFSGKQLTRAAVTENLNVLDYDTYFKSTDLILNNRIPELLVLFNTILAQGFEGHHYIGGLASHFRDLLVCRHEETLPLLEVGENAREQYAEQAKKTPEEFLLNAIDIATDCELKYKASKNQRLLVELTLMKLASLNFDSEKKKHSNNRAGHVAHPGLIPAAFYRKKPAEKANLAQKRAAVLEQYQAEKEKPEVEEVAVAELAQPQTTPAKKINLKNARERVSGLSLSSLKVKKSHQAQKKTSDHPEGELPKEAFELTELEKHWTAYAHKLEKKGRKILASSLMTAAPRIYDEQTIAIDLPNDTMKKEIEMEREPLLAYLRGKLNNYHLVLRVDVREEEGKRFAFTPEEKYQKMRDKNPSLDLLRKTFDLEL